MGQCAALGSGEDNAPLAPWFGILLGLTASVGINIGNNLQALGMEERKTLQDSAAKEALAGLTDVQTPAIPMPNIWKAGTALFVTSALVNFAAFGFAPASILAPLESVQFISNLLFSRVVRKIPITPRALFATVLIVSGTTLAVVFGPNDVYTFTQEDLIGFWAQAAWIVYVVLALMTFGALQFLHVSYKKAAAESKPLPYNVIVSPVTFAGSSVLVGTQCVVQAKCLSELLELLLAGTNIFACWYIYIVIILFVGATVLWLSRLSQALETYDPLYIVPMLQSGYIVVSAIAAGIYFQEFATLSTIQWIFFVGGIQVMLVGLALLIDPSAMGGGDDISKEEQQEAAGGDVFNRGVYNSKSDGMDRIASTTENAGMDCIAHISRTTGDSETTIDTESGRSRTLARSATATACDMAFMLSGGAGGRGITRMHTANKDGLTQNERLSQDRHPIQERHHSQKERLDRE